MFFQGTEIASNKDGVQITPLDGLNLINFLNRAGSG